VLIEDKSDAARAWQIPLEAPESWCMVITEQHFT